MNELLKLGFKPMIEDEEESFFIKDNLIGVSLKKRKGNNKFNQIMFGGTLSNEELNKINEAVQQYWKEWENENNERK